MHTPLFSIVIPTYNRSELVHGAIRSVLGQTVDDFEVVVSDNCSTDDTQQVVEHFGDSRVRYVRTPTHGVIGDSWEFARSQARGELIMMLSDDDALVHDALERFADTHDRFDADFLFSNLAEYRDRSFKGPQQNTVSCRAFSGKTRVVSVDELLGPLFQFRPKFDMHPSAFMFSRRIADEVVRRCGRFFQTNGVEYFAWPLAAVFSRGIGYMDAPLVILGRTAKSWGSTVVLSNPGKQQIERMIADAAQARDWIPLANFTLINLMAEGMFLAKRLFPVELKRFPIDERHYLRRTMVELKRRVAMGVDVNREMRELLEYSKKFPAVHAELTRRERTGWTAEDSVLRKFGRALGLNIINRRREALREIKKVKQGRVMSGFCVSGDDFGFQDAPSCAEFVARIAQMAVANSRELTGGHAPVQKESTI
jgi:glycosyltransferase involved in cell wall biosynthesis